MPEPKTVEIVMTVRQARQFASWLGDHYMKDLPPDLAREIQAMSVALRRGESVDVSGLRFVSTEPPEVTP